MSDATDPSVYVDCSVCPGDGGEPFELLVDQQDVERAELTGPDQSFEAAQADAYPGILQPARHADGTGRTVPAEIGLTQLDIDSSGEREVTATRHRTDGTGGVESLKPDRQRTATDVADGGRRRSLQLTERPKAACVAPSARRPPGRRTGGRSAEPLSAPRLPHPAPRQRRASRRAH